MGEGTEEIRREIEHTREEMTDTVDALAYKLDVPERAREKVRDTAEQAGETVREKTDQAQHAASEAAHVAARELEARRGKVESFVRRNPVQTALGALAIGLVAALVALRR
jgi:ElaB/YqjD/DUF883 family membrane-anchored ribosome-binding protein